MNVFGHRAGWALCASMGLALIAGCGEKTPPAAAKYDTPQAAITAFIAVMPAGDLDVIAGMQNADSRAQMNAFREKAGEAAAKQNMTDMAAQMKTAQPQELKVEGDQATQEFVVDAKTRIIIGAAKEGDSWRIASVRTAYTMGSTGAPQGATPDSGAQGGQGAPSPEGAGRPK